MPSDDVAIYVFSFNRGVFLRHCLATLRACMPASPITIVDDGSADRVTLEVLAEEGRRCSVIKARQTEQGEARTGGLYPNMNWAFHDARAKGCKYVLFIQDDMQLVRPFTESGMAAVERCFQRNVDMAEINACFIRRESEHLFRAHFRVDESGFVYLPKDGHYRGKSHFASPGLFDVERILTRFGELATGELRNSVLAHQRGLVMGRAVYPFLNWLPYPSSPPSKRRLEHRLMEAMGGAGFHPITMMSKDEVDTFLERDPAILPIAEDFLRSPTAPRSDVWSTAGRKYNVLARGGWRAKLFRAVRSPRSVLWPKTGGTR